MLLLHQPVEPIFTEKLNRMLRPDGPISAAEVISWTKLVTPPADALWVFWMNWEIAHAFAFTNAGRGRFEPRKRPTSLISDYETTIASPMT